MSTSVGVLIGLLAILSFLVAPITIVWGWARWKRVQRSRTVSAKLSLMGFNLASASGLLAALMIAFAQIHRFGWYDPLLMKGMVVGLLLSLSGLLFGLSGIWRDNPLRWYAPVSAIATMAFWLLQAAMQ